MIGANQYGSVYSQSFNYICDLLSGKLAQTLNFTAIDQTSDLELHLRLWFKSGEK